MALKFELVRRFPLLIDLHALWQSLTRLKPVEAECTCCGQTGRFRLSGVPPRVGARCPNCFSLERHRLLRLYINTHPELVDGQRILHFAPEKSLRAYLSPRAAEYIGCDISPRPGDRRIDIEAIDLPDASIDLVVCSHVLEHVDDRKALSELRRIIAPGGTVLLMFPIIEGWAATYENPAVTTPAERIKHFGQEDHVRYFGADARDRMRAAGFFVEDFTAVEPLVSRHALSRGGKIFVCRPT